jgi:hypothetical protein
LSEARTLLALCDRFRKLPSEILAEDAHLFELLAIEGRYGADG